MEQLASEYCCSLVAVPELARIPILCESFHGQFALKVIFRLPLQRFKLFLSCIPLAVKFFQCTQGTGGQLSSLLSSCVYFKQHTYGLSSSLSWIGAMLACLPPLQVVCLKSDSSAVI